MIMTAKQILEEIKPLGSDSYKRVIFNHGVKEPCFGVKISALQKIVKRVKKDYQLALDLYDTGIQTAEKIGPVMADLGNNSCHVPFAPDYIRKVQKRGAIGKKRKSAKC